MPQASTTSVIDTSSATLTKPHSETSVFCALSGDYTGLSFVFEATRDGTNWFPVAAIQEADAQVVSGTISPSDASNRAWRLPAEFVAQVRARVTAISTNTATFNLASSSFVGQAINANTVSGQTIAGTMTLADGSNLVAGTTTGTKVGTATTQKLGFYNATPIVQRSGAAEAAVVTTATTQTTPFGFATQAQGDNLVALANELRATLVALGLFKGAA